MILTVTPNPSLDRTYTTGSVVADGVNRALTDTVEASGKGVNVSRALHAAGIATMAVLTAGGNEGEQLRALLEEEALPHILVPTQVSTRTNVTVVEPGRTTKINSPGQPLTQQDYDALVAVVSTRAREARHVVISGSMPPGASEDLVPRLVATARQAGARTTVDASGAALRAAAKAEPDLLAPNADELAELTGRTLSGNGRGLVYAALGAAVAVSRSTGSALLVSLGADGALWVERGGKRAVHAAAPPLTPVNTAGAGDALLAGWLAGDEDIASERLARAVAWGTAACLLPGTSGDVPGGADVATVTVTDLTTAAGSTIREDQDRLHT
ncbi:1-phosphofructokinase [Kibdelosporangium banguiense]|uniref:1-phosphofructokinase n=1 Tax=Kibdelosporangium banguiense TaxID=1365924 RepID=A0ABS4TJ66_9PSEU|nr:1-phosphofructokinase family hexose kinase [Kibdelosporangium banguiense]MBP2324450.1 1-phosphofructokinase [Kibdelosporangium banguiense]